MQTPLQAMLWEVWRTSRLQLLIRLVTVAAAVIFFGTVSQNADEPTAQMFRGLMIVMLFNASVFIPTWLVDLESKHVGFSFHLGFIRPVSTTQLVMVPLLYAVVISVVSYWLQALLFSVLSGIWLPLASPSVVIACAIVWLLAALWSPTNIAGRAVSVGALILAIVLLFVAHHVERGDPEPILLAMGKPDYFDLKIHHYLTLLIVTAIATVTTLFSVNRQRHGDHWQLDLWSFDQATSGSPAKPWKPFRSPIAAQFWFEMRRFGQTLLIAGVGAPLGMFLFVTACLFVPAWRDAPYAWLLALVICPLLYQFIGVDGSLGLKSNQGSIEYSSFEGTRPLRNDQMIAIKLLVIIACSLFGWLCMGLAAGLHATMAGQWTVWAGIGASISAAVGAVSVYWWMAGMLSAVLLYISSSSMLMAFALLHMLRPGLTITIGALMAGHLMLALWDSRHGWPCFYLWTAYGYILPVVIVVACISALKRALSTGFLGSRLFGCAFCLWVIYVGSTVVLYINSATPTPLPTGALLVGGSLLLVPLAATAIAPLALAAHRHA